MINIGQNSFAAAPVAGFTFLPHGGTWEASSKFEYILNAHDAATHYHSGNEFTWEYDAMRQVSKQVALGANGYWYRQTSDDHLNGLKVGDGNRGRDLAIGPEARIHCGEHFLFAVKYFRDTLVENRPRGNAFWFQMGIPLTLGRRPQSLASLPKPVRPDSLP
jgi:hypothetical protein